MLFNLPPFFIKLCSLLTGIVIDYCLLLRIAFPSWPLDDFFILDFALITAVRDSQLKKFEKLWCINGVSNR